MMNQTNATAAATKSSPDCCRVCLFQRDLSIVLDLDGSCRVCTLHAKPLTADQRDGGARWEGWQNVGIDY